MKILKVVGVVCVVAMSVVGGAFIGTVIGAIYTPVRVASWLVGDEQPSNKDDEV